MRIAGEEPKKRYVTVKDRDKPGLVIQAGHNMGAGDFNVWAFVILFEDTGEVRFYDANQVTNVE